MVQIGARDQGTPSLESEDTVTVTLVVSRNNNAPVFLQPYEVDVRASVPRNTELITVQATDSDSNSKLTYSINRMLFTKFCFDIL